MKKFMAIFIAAVLCASLLTGCNSPQAADAYNLYMNMSEAMADVKSIDMDISAVSDVYMDSGDATSVMSGNIKQIIKSDTDFDMSINMSIKVSDMEVSGTEIPITGYYTDGIYYTETGGVKSSFSMSVEEAMTQTGMSHTELLDFPESAIKDFKISNQDGGKKVELTLDGNAVTSLIDKNQGTEVLNIGDIVCELLVDKNNMLKSYHIIYEMSMIIMEETTNIKSDVTLTVNSYNDLTEIEFPSDLDEYIYMGAN